MKVQKLFFCLLKSQIPGEKMPELDIDLVVRKLPKLYNLSKFHDVVPIVTSALENIDVPKDNETFQNFKKQSLVSLMRYENIKHELVKICKAFDRESIPYILLKGSKIRQFYKKPYMRTSCDIDVLVKDEDVERATDVLCENFGYITDRVRSFHNVSLFSKSKVHIELHFNILEHIHSMDKVLEKVWDYAHPFGENTSEYILTNEFMMFHLISHAAYHFKNGGCGVRPFLDIFLVDKNTQYDKAVLNGLLKDAHLEEFAQKCFELSQVWFGEKQHSQITLDMENFLLSAGVYGLLENKVASQHAGDKSKLHYTLKRIFMPFETLKELYEGLEKRPYLYPYYTVRRWCRILLGKNTQRAFKELSMNTNMTDEKKTAMIKLFDDLDIGNLEEK